MFESLKKKLGGWFGKKEPEAEKKEEKKKVAKSEKVKETRKKVEKVGKKAEVKSKEAEKKDKKEKISKKVEKKAEKKLVNVKEEKNAEEKIDESEVEFFGEDEKEIEEEESESLKSSLVHHPPTHREEVEISREKKEELEEKVVEEEEREEEISEKGEEAKEEVEERGGFFARLAGKLTKSELEEEDFNVFFDEFEMILLENNVALAVVDKIRENLKGELVGKQFKKKEVEGKILGALKGAIDSVLIEGEDLIGQIKAKKSREPFVILFFGINGSGKTTSIAKLAWKLKEKGISCVLVAGDTFRAASIEQLETHANRIGVPIVKGEYGKDPSSVGFDGIAYAKKHGIKVVLIDTAGRMYTKSNLLKEMEKIVKVCKPDLKIFVGESITGNDATEQAKTFNEVIGLDGIILSKADVDEKAGTILSVSYVTGKPIYFLGVGQGLDDLILFRKSQVLKHLGLD